VQGCIAEECLFEENGAGTLLHTRVNPACFGLVSDFFSELCELSVLK